MRIWLSFQNPKDKKWIRVLIDDKLPFAVLFKKG
jgi:hypothetical protein